MIAFLKSLAGFVVPLGAEAITGGIVAEAVKNQGTLTKIAAGISGAVIGWWLGEKASDFLDDELDEWKEKWDKARLKEADE